ncbi:MAG: hypothetical protein FWD12_06355 [Alphaproteobacteria bacterium]|nr:hypothetical protein [Alphaproteobacteria bacterium]
MRASKFIVLSTAALLAGSASQTFAASPATSGTQQTEPKGHVGGHVGGHAGAMGQGQHYRGEAQTHRGEIHRDAHGEARGYVTTLSSEEQMRLREMVRDIPRLTHIGDTDIRIDGYVPRSVRQAAAPLPLEVQHMHPRFRRDRAFRYHDQVVILNPMTSRIVAIVKTPA